MSTRSDNVVHIGAFAAESAGQRRSPRTDSADGAGALAGTRAFAFGDWCVYPLDGAIRRGDRAVHIEPKVMEVLVLLAEGADRVVLRRDLLERVWGVYATVSDESLTRCISVLRKALGDSARSPEYILTIPKRGYRLLQSVSRDVSGRPARNAGGSPQRPRFWSALRSMAGRLALAMRGRHEIPPAGP